MTEAGASPRCRGACASRATAARTRWSDRPGRHSSAPGRRSSSTAGSGVAVPSLTDITLDDLRRRRSAKWTAYPKDVLPAWVAEMDFPLAPAVKAVLREAVEADDAGYAAP